MMRNLLLAAAVAAAAGSPALAQDARVEVSATAGWTFSDGVSTDLAVSVPGVGIFDQIDPADSFSWGARIGFNTSENVEVGFMFDLQKTSLDIVGSSTVTFGDMSVYNYHGYFAYNFLETDSVARPYVLLGFGATQYGSVKPEVGNRQFETEGEVQFSSTWAAGVKIFPSKTFGIRLEGKWTPTYIKSDPGGYWCDPYWGCYMTGDAQYSNQFELSGGITLRF